MDTCSECDHLEHMPDCQGELAPASDGQEAILCGCMGPRPTKAELDEAALTFVMGTDARA